MIGKNVEEILHSCSPNRYSLLQYAIFQTSFPLSQLYHCPHFLLELTETFPLRSSGETEFKFKIKQLD